MSPHPFWRSGDIGRVISGPLAGVEGVVVKSKQFTRLILSINLLQRSVLLEIDPACVVLVEEGRGTAFDRAGVVPSGSSLSLPSSG